ncbi:MAG: VWA domain-containing protein [Terracidiphilus sp.]|jgi:VWFA-related protein
MSRIGVSSFFCAMLCIPLCGSGSGQTAPGAGAPMTTIHTSSDLVVVDVVASDSQQNPVHKLTAADFTVVEDGKPQTVKIFEEHQTQTSAPLPPAPKLAPGIFTNFSIAPVNGALNILLLDKLNTPMDAQTVVRDQVLKYLKEVHPGTRIAIFSLTTELRLLQGFTSNPELLRALVEGKKGNQGASPLMNNAMEGDQPGADDPMYDMDADMLGNDPSAAMILANLQQFEVEQQSFQLQLRARYTMDALNQLARYMSALPGRKNLIWFSGSFPVNIMPDPDMLTLSANSTATSGAFTPDPFAGVASLEDEFRETVDLLARSQVAVYPIDARGLMVNPTMSATQSGSTMNRKPNGFANANTKFFQQTSEEHGTMEEMAQATGGKAFVNTNGLKEAVEKAIEAGSNYYTIAYTPTNRKWNGDYRKIQVKLDRPGVTLAYRRGYFADDPNAPAQKTQAQNAKPDPNQYSALRAAMLHGGPEPTELIFAASVRSTSTDTEAALVPGNQAVKKVSGPYRRYAVTFITNPKELNWTVTPDGAHRCTLEFMTFVYDGNGERINVQVNGIGAAIPEAQFASVENGNIKYVQQISVPAKGDYYLRLGMRDVGSDHVGAVELPVDAVAKLPPIAVPLPAPSAK